MMYHKCPMCGSKFNVEKVVSWPVVLPQSENDDRDFTDWNGVFKVAGVDKGGKVCCSYDDFKYNTREAADWAALNFTANTLEELDIERTQEAMAVTDEHGYFMDYGPCDSDPYDY